MLRPAPVPGPFVRLPSSVGQLFPTARKVKVNESTNETTTKQLSVQKKAHTNANTCRHIKKLKVLRKHTQ